MFSCCVLSVFWGEPGCTPFGGWVTDQATASVASADDRVSLRPARTSLFSVATLPPSLLLLKDLPLHSLNRLFSPQKTFSTL